MWNNGLGSDTVCVLNSDVDLQADYHFVTPYVLLNHIQNIRLICIIVMFS